MHIVKEVTQPNGAVTPVHRISNVQLTTMDPMSSEQISRVNVLINSYASAEATTVAWQTTIPMPIEDYAAAVYPANIVQFLTAPGGLLEGGDFVQGEATDLERAQAQALARVNALRDRKIKGGFEIDGVGIFDSDDASIRNIQGTCLRAQIAITTEENDWVTGWKLADNSVVVLDAEAMFNVGVACSNHVTGCYVRSWELKALIEAAEDIETLNAIEIDADWP